jgi:acetyltransferase-like isoleucine patch superfamily enzyme
MRKITFFQVAVFLALFSIALGLTIVSTSLSLGEWVQGDFRGFVLILSGIGFLYVYAIVIYRLFLHIFPLRQGEIAPGSSQEFVYHVYLLFYLILFYPIMRSGFVPVPIMRIVYLSLGAHLGRNTYSSGILFDPPFIYIGDNTIVGQYALLVPHAIEGTKLTYENIRVGSNVTIGAHAVVLSGVTIEDDALVATGAVVTKGTYIRHGEIWGGVPARRLPQK